MTIRYKLQTNMEGNNCAIAKIVKDVFVASIPFAEDNTDYQEYLAWVAEGNEPEPAEEV